MFSFLQIDEIKDKKKQAKKVERAQKRKREKVTGKKETEPKAKKPLKVKRQTLKYLFSSTFCHSIT